MYQGVSLIARVITNDELQELWFKVKNMVLEKYSKSKNSLMGIVLNQKPIYCPEKKKKSDLKKNPK